MLLIKNGIYRIIHYVFEEKKIEKIVKFETL